MRTVLVTGANRGIGKAIAVEMAKRGFHVLGGMRKRDESLADFPNIRPVQLDVASAGDIAQFAKTHAADVDVLINNAGVLFDAPLLEDPAGFDSCMNVMVAGPYHLIRACAPHMRARDYGRVVNISSDWGSFHEGLGGPGAYGIAKAALNALTVRLSRELPSTVKVNAMCPGWVRTRMGTEAATRAPEEAADTAVWLATLDEDGPTGGFFRDRQPLNW